METGTMLQAGVRCASSVMHTTYRVDDRTGRRVCCACDSEVVPDPAAWGEPTPIEEKPKPKRRGRYTRLSDPVRHPVTGATTTIADLLDSGEATMVCHPRMMKRGGGTRVAYCAELSDGAGWEVSPVAYRTRTGLDAFEASA